MIECMYLYIKVPILKEFMLSAVLLPLSSEKLCKKSVCQVTKSQKLNISRDQEERYCLGNRYAFCLQNMGALWCSQFCFLTGVYSTENKGCVFYKMNLISPLLGTPKMLCQILEENELVLTLTFKCELLVKVPPVEMSIDINTVLNY